MRAMAVLVVLASLLSAPAAQAAPSTVRVLQLNLCHGGTAGCFTGDRVITKAKEVITSVKPQVLSLNEICSGDVAVFQRAMGEAKARFNPARRDGAAAKCVNGQEYGNAILVATTLAGTSAGVVGTYTAQDSRSEKRTWACLPAGRLTACTTHLSACDRPVALAQCRALLAKAATYAAKPVIVAGDINLKYQGEVNAQSCNRDGFYRKGDGDLQHVFATTSLTHVSTTTTSMAGTTDHPALTVTVTLTP